jgi:trk system potassium uptake protein TrkH
MHKTAVAYTVGRLMQAMGLVLLIPLGIGLWDGWSSDGGSVLLLPEVSGFVLAVVLSLLFGSALALAFRSGRGYLGVSEGYAIVTFGWISLAFVAAIPLCAYFLATHSVEHGGFALAFTDAYFEVMSGFTTTGASILSDIEAVPRSLLFLRALTHWLGGMGIITLAIAILPAMSVSGYQMFRGEVPGPSKDKLMPRLKQTASILWGVYLLFTAAETVLLMVGGMNLFDAVCHSFATMATGGFSNSNQSIAGYNSAFIEWVVIFFMYLAGVNFVLHFRALRGDVRSMVTNKEFVFYNGVIIVAIVVITGVLSINGLDSEQATSQHFRHDAMTSQEFSDHYAAQEETLDSFGDTFRVAVFQTLAIVTTTGFVTADFDLWPSFLLILLVMLMFFGGCAGSTGGGMKMIRIMIVARVAINQLRKLTQPRLVAPVKIGNEAIDDKMVINVMVFSILFVALFVLVATLMTLFVPDMTTAVACSIATIGNIGPGLSGVGAAENYGWIPLPGKWILIFSMLLGRLEIFTVLVIFRLATWRK